MDAIVALLEHAQVGVVLCYDRHERRTDLVHPSLLTSSLGFFSIYTTPFIVGKSLFCLPQVSQKSFCSLNYKTRYCAFLYLLKLVYFPSKLAFTVVIWAKLIVDVLHHGRTYGLCCGLWPSFCVNVHGVGPLVWQGWGCWCWHVWWTQNQGKTGMGGKLTGFSKLGMFW